MPTYYNLPDDFKPGELTITSKPKAPPPPPPPGAATATPGAGDTTPPKYTTATQDIGGMLGLDFGRLKDVLEETIRHNPLFYKGLKAQDYIEKGLQKSRGMPPTSGPMISEKDFELGSPHVTSTGGTQGVLEDLIRTSFGPMAPFSYLYPLATLRGIGAEDLMRNLGAPESVQLLSNMLASGGPVIERQGVQGLARITSGMLSANPIEMAHGALTMGSGPLKALPLMAGASGAWPRNELTPRGPAPDYVTGRETSPFP
jgi:hypothetical protein